MSVAVCTASASGQSPAAPPKDLQSEIETVKTENAAVRELLRKMEEQQKMLLEQVDRLQRRLDGVPTVADASVPSANVALNAPQPVTTSASASAQPAAVAAPEANKDRYRDGMVIWETSEGAKVPFLLKFNVNTQLRYLNTQNSDETFTDHLG